MSEVLTVTDVVWKGFLAVIVLLGIFALMLIASEQILGHKNVKAIKACARACYPARPSYEHDLCYCSNGKLPREQPN